MGAVTKQRLVQAGLVATALAHSTAFGYVAYQIGWQHSTFYFGIYTCIVLAVGIMVALVGLYPNPNKNRGICLMLSALILIVGSLPFLYDTFMYPPGLVL